MNYKTKNWKEDTEELYFGLKTAFNCFDMSSTYNQLIFLKRLNIQYILYKLKMN